MVMECPLRAGACHSVAEGALAAGRRQRGRRHHPGHEAGVRPAGNWPPGGGKAVLEGTHHSGNEVWVIHQSAASTQSSWHFWDMRTSG